MKKYFAPIPLFFLLALPAILRAQTAVPPKSPDTPAPATTPAPLPDIPTLLHQVELARQHNSTMMENYFFDATTTVHETNGHTDVKVAEIFYINGVRLERQISHNGKPLPPEDAEKEKERSDKAVAKAKERVAKAQSKGEETDSNGDTLISLNRLLDLFTVSNERRETVNGRSAIAFDFTRNRSVKPKGIAEGMMQSMSGTVWIDEKEHEIAKMSGSMADGYRVGFGLIMNIAKGTGGTVEFTPVNNEVWLPARLDGQGHARFLLVDDALDGTESTVFSNYHKFATGVKVLPAQDADGSENAPAPAKP